MNQENEHTQFVPRVQRIWSGEEISRKILPCILNIGESLMRAGADVNHVERLIERLGIAYGAKHMNVFVITESIIVTMTISDGREYTQTRRVGPTEINFYKLECLNKLCRSVHHMPLPPDELLARFREIDGEARTTSWIYVGALFVVAGYSAFFGGTIPEIIVSSLFSLVLCFLVEKLSKKTPNLIGFNFLASFIMGVLIGIMTKVFPSLTVDTMISGVIMVIIPGLAITNSIRDMLSGDTLAGLLRFAESFLWTVAMVFGFTIALMLLGLTVHTNISIAPWRVKYIAIIPATLGLLLYYYSRRRLMIYGFVGALISFPVYVFVENVNPPNEFLPVLAASFVAAVYAEFFARRMRVPTSVFFVVAIMPLIPGRLLFSTVTFLVQGNYELAGQIGSTAALTSLGIATAICIVWTISRTWENFHINQRIADIIH